MGNNSSQYEGSSEQVHQPVFYPHSEPILLPERRPLGKPNITPKMKHWVKGNNIKCYMVYANGLRIAWAEDATRWLFHNINTSDGEITVAILRSVNWLEAHGRLHTSKLTPGVTYQVAFVIMVEESGYGFKVPVNFRLTLPDGTKQEHKENLYQKPKEEWIRIPLGEFKVYPENVGEIEFSLYETQSGDYKKGLVIQGVVIEPRI